ncbi:DUF1800 domain-containing protein [Mucilaginibacter ginkgonis]|uniref:DUF1800 domain-containing protein n=1 Tax=Mucilaginibacter ginkgonis TaxID=2682091 RepID=A0A6I4HZF9_9SPHI|nr:DUF1800 domain-containing protein [Mucilaginibacter ginkgonis]QQL48818.1 DUF1800 domain-containing protein [Mucilaginibacter ginkgonis]
MTDRHLTAQHLAAAPPAVFGNAELIHLLNRTTFGVSRSDINALSGKNLNQVVATLFTQPAVPAPPVNGYNDANYTDANVPAGTTWVNAPYTDGTANSRRLASFKAWWMGLMINQNSSILEKMVLFWHNHFATQTSTVDDARFVYKHNALLRQYALGNFKDFVKQITLDPAMLKYLNGYVNVKSAPDENYGRELQELFTVGKGPNSKYTEDDVKAAAKVLTGYTINTTLISSSFDATRHDATNKTFSAFYGNTVITGKTGANGSTELDDLINMIFKNNEVALFICRKLYRYFVYYNIDAATEANVIVPLADIFRKNNYEIKPVLQALFTSDYFYADAAKGCVIKDPVNLVAGMMREFNVTLPGDADYVNQYYMLTYLQTIASNIGQSIGDPPNVSGWPAYYQVPEYHELWINSDTLPKRNQFTDTLIGNGYTRNGKKLVIDTVAYTASLPTPADPNLLITDMLAQLYQVTVSQETIDFLKGILLSGQISDHYWTDAWNALKANPTDAANLKVITTRLQTLYKYIMDLPEYQLS